MEMDTPEETRAKNFEDEAENVKQELIQFERYVRWKVAYYYGMANAVRNGTEKIFTEEYLKKNGICHVDTKEAIRQDV